MKELSVPWSFHQHTPSTVVRMLQEFPSVPDVWLQFANILGEFEGLAAIEDSSRCRDTTPCPVELMRCWRPPSALQSRVIIMGLGIDRKPVVIDLALANLSRRESGLTTAPGAMMSFAPGVALCS